MFVPLSKSLFLSKGLNSLIHFTYWFLMIRHGYRYGGRLGLKGELNVVHCHTLVL